MRTLVPILRTSLTAAFGIAVVARTGMADPAHQHSTATTEHAHTRYGASISAGGGVSGFTQSTMRATTHDGGAWGVRGAIGLTSYLGGEAEYTGSVQSIDAPGLDNDALLVSSGVQGDLRVNVLPRSKVQPYVFGGVAYRHYEVTRDSFNRSRIREDDDVLEIPMGVGVGWSYRGLLLDARGEYRYANYEDLVPETASAHADMHRYGVNGSIGATF
jgi:hypothetical protein